VPHQPQGHVSNPAARVYKGDMEAFGKKDEFPYAATTYRLTEHLHYWTKHVRSNAIVQPAPFVEIGEDLAKEKGIKQGDKVKGAQQPRRGARPRRRDQAHEGRCTSTARRCTTSASPSTGASRA
jgi:predicted molibdopterin-dependent oxidoreductase YjgC